MERSDGGIQASLMRRAAAVCAVTAGVALTTGILVLVGWAVDEMPLKSAFSRGVTMKANTALGLACGGAAVLLLRQRERSAVQERLGRALAALIGLLGAATLSEHVLGWNLGIDQMLFEESLGALATVSPGRMGPPAALCMTLLGIALLSLDRGSPARSSPAQLLAIVVASISMLPMLGYLCGAEELYGIARYTGIAMHAATALFCMGVATFLARPLRRPAAVFLLPDAGGQLARRLLPAVVVIPITLQLVLRELSERHALMDSSFSRALLLLSLMGVFALLVWGSALRLSEASQRRDLAEQASANLLRSEQKARAEAEHAAQLKDDFVAMVSHELRTPLNAITGWATILGTEGASKAQLDRGLKVIERNARAQARLIDDLLDVSRIASGKLKVEREAVDLRAVLRGTLGAVGPSAADKGVELNAPAERDTIFVQGDAARLQQILSNLISNAIKFTPKGGRVDVELRMLEGLVEIDVRDSGIGIDPSFMPHIFDRFRQADSGITRRHGGLGLGLSIAQTLAELHGGTLRAFSAGSGRGSTFTLSLPLPVEHAEPQAVAGGRAAAPAEKGLLSGLHVLVVDDDQDARELLDHVLSEAGAIVTCAASAQQGLDVLDSSHAQLLVTDIGMPDQDGYELLRRVRRRHDENALPAIALTAFARGEDEQRALESGFQAHLAKPVDLGELIRAISTLRPRA